MSSGNKVETKTLPENGPTCKVDTNGRVIQNETTTNQVEKGSMKQENGEVPTKQANSGSTPSACSSEDQCSMMMKLKNNLNEVVDNINAIPVSIHAKALRASKLIASKIFYIGDLMSGMTSDAPITEENIMIIYNLYKNNKALYEMLRQKAQDLKKIDAMDQGEYILSNPLFSSQEV